MMIHVLIFAVALAETPQASEPQPATSTGLKTATKNASGGFNQISRDADRARDAGQNDQAIRLYTKALALQPSWKEGLWSLSALLYEKEQYSGARDVLRRFVACEPELGLAWAMLGMSEFQTREYSRSLDHLQRAVAQGMGDHKEIAESVFYHLAMLQNRFEQYDDSADLLIGMVKSGQQAGPLTEVIGLAVLRLPLMQSEIPPNRHDLARMAGEATLALEGQRRDDAERLFTKMVEAYPNEAGVHFLYGVFLLDARPEDGLRELKKEIEVSPSSVPARLRLAEEYIKEQRADLAQVLAQEAVKFDPKRSAAHMMLGEALVAKGDLAAGIKELETARDEAPQTVRIRWDLLRAYTTAGRADDAKREKEEIEKLSNPGSGK
jgi:tetratricopeptide (TPR) repeat protein